VAIIRTGSANLASVTAAFARLAVEVVITEDPEEVLAAAAVVLPGVGAFGPAACHLRDRGLDEAIRKRVRSGRPVLAICLGMQLLCESSDESSDVPGLGIVPAHVARLVGDVRVPQMGWNRIAPTPSARLLHNEWMYFAHSFAVMSRPNTFEGSMTEHGSTFVSALERGSLLACQFHPELSGPGGLALIDRWLRTSNDKRGVAC
jgi:imidazole glycerol phosphate synthase glutamine amidotransferase subunit